MEMHLQIDAGAISDPLWKQIERQGVAIPGDTIDMCQRDMDAISRLFVRGLIPDSTARRARQRVVKKIASCATRKG